MDPGRRRALLLDVVPVVLLAAVTGAALFRMRDGSPGTGETAVAVLLWLPALVRNRWPLPAFAATALLVAVHWVPDGFDAGALLPPDLALLVVLGAVAERCTLAWAAVATVVCELFALATLLGTAPPDATHPAVPLSALTAAALLFGRNRRARHEVLAGLRDRAERAERERDQQARVAVAEERTRIAREVHDVVSHNISVMTALADGAGYALRSEPGRQQAGEAIASVATTGREALAEMHRLLGVLRQAEDGSSPRRPAPGLDDLLALVDQLRAAGLPTTLTVSGEPAPLGAAAQLAVYRLVQEALTNTLKHAPDARRASVTLDWDGGGLTVTVRDNGRTPPAPADRVGHGLVGMRERIGAHGGTVTAGPEPSGGWRVTARLPLPVPAT